jgi:two-component system OmpR family response regulator
MSLPAPPDSGKFRILVVEDDPSVARLILSTFSRAGFDCRYAPDGLEGWRAFNEAEPHLLLTDLMMPGLSGQELCLKIREQSTIPIIIMTAADTEEAQLQGFKGGADDYVAKPFNPKMLTARIIAHLRRVYRYDFKESVESEEQRLPSDWAQCNSCGYMGPIQRFAKEVVTGERKNICPVCGQSENVAYAVG